MEENTLYYRNCPICNIEITYKNKRKYKYAITINTNCRSCAQKIKPRKQGIENKLFGIKRPDMCGENNPAKKQDVKEKISKKLKGRIGAMTGKLHSEESKEKSRISNTGQKRTEKTKENIRNATLRQIENGFHSSNPFCKKTQF